ncbi:class I SAM-dependent methyltransferase [Halopiger djelfimassiliensis]|uniref:class I SAM-dependent methyltransferase n=1 Tax=Halopiger djelfimassiliensis TaxID=1293047 RepID=UPI000678171F|nr:class I SAM-dependent methyltransferase [Halopiger djelfimassiliensis]
MVDKDVVRRGYDDVAPVYAAERATDGRSTAILERFLESLPEAASVLDAGCGQGTPVLRNASAVGLDFSGEQLALAAANAPGAALVRGDLAAPPFAADSFDAVVAYWSLIHVPREDRQATIDEFARLLCSGGRALLCVGKDDWRGTNPDWLESGAEMQWDLAGAAATRDHLRNAGFAVVDEWTIVDPLEEDSDDAEPAWVIIDARLDR